MRVGYLLGASYSALLSNTWYYQSSFNKGFEMPKKGYKRGPLTEEHRLKISLATKGRKKAEGAGCKENTPEILWGKVDKRGEDECWPWLGGVNDEYGRVRINGKKYYAHRVIFNLTYPNVIELKAPKIDRDTTGFLLHKCDNPICCNPNHLMVGSQLDNIRDRDSKNRHADFSGEKNPRSKFSLEQVNELRELRKTGMLIIDLANKHKVSYSCMKRLLSGRTYRG